MDIDPLRAHCIGSRVGPRAGLKAVAKTKVPAPAWSRTPAVTILAELPRLSYKLTDQIPHKLYLLQCPERWEDDQE